MEAAGYSYVCQLVIWIYPSHPPHYQPVRMTLWSGGDISVKTDKLNTSCGVMGPPPTVKQQVVITSRFVLHLSSFKTILKIMYLKN